MKLFSVNMMSFDCCCVRTLPLRVRDVIFELAVEPLWLRQAGSTAAPHQPD